MSETRDGQRYYDTGDHNQAGADRAVDLTARVKQLQAELHKIRNQWHIDLNDKVALQAKVKKLEGENEKLRDLLAGDTVFPVLSCLRILSEATDHLLKDHGCDVHGYEQFASAVKAAKEHVKKFEQALQPKEIEDDTSK